MNATWGYENRSCAVRAIRSDRADLWRFECRRPGADANPYLALAAIAAAAVDGSTRARDPPPPIEGDAYALGGDDRRSCPVPSTSRAPRVRGRRGLPQRRSARSSADYYATTRALGAEGLARDRHRLGTRPLRPLGVAGIDFEPDDVHHRRGRAPTKRSRPVTVTFLFTDIEGSTRLLRELGDKYAHALAEHRRILRAVFEARAGVEVDTQGDAFFYSFARATDALAAAGEAQAALAAGPVQVRIGIHTGEPEVTPEGYVGLDVHAAARIAACAYGGQVILSRRRASSPRPIFEVTDLGEHRLKDLDRPVHLYQLGGRYSRRCGA